MNLGSESFIHYFTLPQISHKYCASQSDSSLMACFSAFAIHVEFQEQTVHGIMKYNCYFFDQKTSHSKPLGPHFETALQNSTVCKTLLREVVEWIGTYKFKSPADSV